MITETIEPYLQLIKNHAWVALKKIKKPTILTHEDLVSEGIVIFYSIKEEAEGYKYKANKGASFKTFFILNLRNHYSEVVKKSYRYSKEMIQQYSHDSKNKTKSSSTPYFNLESDMIISKLSYRERIYVYLIQSLSPLLKLNQKREMVRKTLNLSKYCENFMRKSIYNKITEKKE